MNHTQQISPAEATPQAPCSYKNVMQTEMELRGGGVARRRNFLKQFAVGGAAAATINWTDALQLQAANYRQKNKACILLWMQGAPSQFETFDPKPDHRNGGETKAIATTLSGIQFAESLPLTAASMDDICLIRSLNGPEGSHPRASYLMHTGYIPNAAVKYPTMGSNVTYQIGDPTLALPNFVRVGQGRTTGGAGLLGGDYAPFVLSDPNKVPSNTTLPTSERRFRRRLDFLDRLESQPTNDDLREEIENHRRLYRKTAKMITSDDMQTFDLADEPNSIRAMYGESQFGAGCLLARRLVEQGVTFVEVNLNGWDTHDDNFARTKSLCEQIDKPYAGLLADLKSRGMLESTLVILVGEFGRTPRVNGRGGRDHYPKAYSGLLAGCGVRGGQVIGATNAGGTEIADRPVGVQDFLRTCFQALDVNANIEHQTSVGRPIPVVEGGEVVKEVFTG